MSVLGYPFLLFGFVATFSDKSKEKLGESEGKYRFRIK